MTYSFFSLDVMSNPAPWSIDGSSPKNTEISQVFDLITQYITLHKVLCIVIYIYILLVIVYINNLSHCTRLSPLFCSCCFNRLFTFNEYSIYRLLSTLYSDTVSDISINVARIDVHVSVYHLVVVCFNRLFTFNEYSIYRLLSYWLFLQLNPQIQLMPSHSSVLSYYNR